MDTYTWYTIEQSLHEHEDKDGSIAAIKDYVLGADFEKSVVAPDIDRKDTLTWNFTRLFQCMIDSEYPMEYCIEQLRLYLQTTHGIGMDSFAWNPPKSIFA